MRSADFEKSAHDSCGGAVLGVYRSYVYLFVGGVDSPENEGGDRGSRGKRRAEAGIGYYSVVDFSWHFAVSVGAGGSFGLCGRR